MKTAGEYGSVRAVVSIVICGMFLLLSAQAFGQEWTAEQKEVWKAVETDIELFKKGDLEGILALRHDDVVIWWSNKPIPYDKELLEINYRS